MKKIALFISSLQKGGSERVMVNLAEYFHQKGYDVLLVTQYKKEVEYDLSTEIKRVYSEPDATKLQGNRIQNFIARYQELRNIWKEHKPDVVLAFIGKNNFMAILTALGLPVKVAVSVRATPSMEYPDKFSKTLANILFRIADGVILQTEQSKDFFSKAIRKKAVVLPNPLNPTFIVQRVSVEKEDVIMATGRLDENKNHAMLIRAFSMIASEFPSMKLCIYGEGEKRQELEQLVKEKQLTGRVFLPGSISNVSEKVSRARIFALTSNTEGMPNSIMEAMALGIPVVSTDCPCGGPATLITHMENGLLVPVGDAYALADAFRQILNNPELERSLGELARSITDDLNPDIVNRKWERYLHSLRS